MSVAQRHPQGARRLIERNPVAPIGKQDLSVLELGNGVSAIAARFRCPSPLISLLGQRAHFRIPFDNSRARIFSGQNSHRNRSASAKSPRLTASATWIVCRLESVLATLLRSFTPRLRNPKALPASLSVCFIVLRPITAQCHTQTVVARQCGVRLARVQCIWLLADAHGWAWWTKGIKSWQALIKP